MIAPVTGELRSGRSVLGRAIGAYVLGRGPGTVLVHGGIHGDEPDAVTVVEEFARQVMRSPLPASAPRLVLVPAANPDGLAAGTKDNARGVDLNRNFPSANYLPDVPGTFAAGYDPGPAPLSEPESAYLAALIAELRPDCLVAVHQPFACVNWDGPAALLAERMAAASGWPVRADLGYATPGSFGSCYGRDRGLPVITLELPGRPDDADVARAVAALRVACRLSP